MVECFALDGIANQLEEERSKEEKVENAGNTTVPSSAWNANQLLMIGIVAAILVLSCAVLVYAARH